MKRTPDDERPNPITRAFSKLFERGDVSRPATPKPRATPRSAPDTAARGGTGARTQGMQAKDTTAGPRRSAAAPTPLAGATRSTPRPQASARAASRPAQSRAASAPTAASATPTAGAEPRTYTVEEGDSLSKIAQQVYGRADRWTLIFGANRDRISDPDLIHPGQVLVLPDTPTLH